MGHRTCLRVTQQHFQAGVEQHELDRKPLQPFSEHACVRRNTASNRLYSKHELDTNPLQPCTVPAYVRGNSTSKQKYSNMN